MSWVRVVVSLVVASTVSAGMAQQDVADAQIEQANMDMIASDNATKNAEEESNRQEAEALTNQARDLLRAKSTATALQANTGIAGVTAEKQKRNIDMQNTFDVGVIKDQADQAVFNIRNQGFANSSSLQNTINIAKAGKPSNTQIAVEALSAGIGTGLMVSGASKSNKGAT